MVWFSYKFSLFSYVAKKTSVFNSTPFGMSTYKVLNVAEKNDAAKRIATILSSNQATRVMYFYIQTFCVLVN